MINFATNSLFIICFDTLKHYFTVDLVAALGGIPGAFFLPFRHLPDKPAKREVQVGGLSLTQPVKRVTDISIIIYPLNP